MQKITTFLMFEGRAEEAMNFYTSLFNDSVKNLAGRPINLASPGS